MKRLTIPFVIALLAAWAIVPLAAVAQTSNYATAGMPEDEGLAMLQVEPYDLIFFTEASGGGWVKVRPLPFPGRRLPTSPSGTLTFSVVGLEAQQFTAKWTDIERVELWEQRLEREARARMDKGDFPGAYPFLAILLRDHATLPGLRALRSEFLLKDAARRYRAGELEPTLAMLEELRRYDPTYQPSTVLRIIGQVTDSLMQRMVEQNDLDNAQQLLARLRRDYPNNEVESIATWDARFLQMAQDKQQEARRAVAAEDWRLARRAALDSLYLYPKIEGGRELVRQIAQTYPMVRVAVMQEATELDPTRIDNWPARRAGRLVYRTLFEMRGTGPEGGEYDFILGDAEQSPDRLAYDLRLRQQKMRPPLDRMTSQTLADLISERASTGTNIFSPPWAASLGSIALRGSQEIACLLRQPHVLPASLLQIRIDGEMLGGAPGEPTGVYRRMEDEGTTSDAGDDAIREVRFALTGDPVTNTQPREIVELKMPTAAAAVAALRRGEVDVIDHLFPSDAALLRNANNIVVKEFPLPTVHMLIPCSEHAFLADRDFRRALLYGINREDILAGELLGNQSVPGCRVVSGPFPAGVQTNDPLAYAYNEQVVPLSYQPQLAKLLVVLTTKRLEAAAERKKETPPKLEPIRLATPDDDLSRLACEAIKTQWELIGLEVEIVTLPPGQSLPDEGTADLVYVTAAVWEPTVDARRVLGPDGLAKSQDQRVGLGLRRVEAANNWRDVRERLHELHATVHSELPILPLWQLVDSFAHRRDITGIGSEIVSLYQNVEAWRTSL